MSASTRRVALGAILAAPLASVPAVANFPNSGKLPDDEAALLALAPRLLPMLDQYDRLWAEVGPYYKAWDQACGSVRPRDWKTQSELPEWNAYLAVREPADELGAQIEALYEPFMNAQVNSLAAIMLKHRYGMTFEAFREDALTELDRLWKEGTLCA